MRLISTIFAGCLLAMTAPAHAQLVINELMQSNIDCIMDDLNDFPDSWVELYNNGSTAVNLSDYKIGKNNKEKKAWKLPSQTIAPKQFVVIYCDKAETGMHTDFRLESGKDGEVYLFKGGEIVDQVTGMKKQPAPNIAYGRKTDGSDSWGYQTEPTPEKTNCGQTVKDILGEPVFSEKGGVFTSSDTHTLTLSLPEGTPEGAEIRYTTTGAEPTKTSALYTSPITISSNHVIRAKIFCDGYLSPRSTVHSYIFFTQRSLTLPVVSIVTDNKYLNDSKIGIYVDGTYQSGKKNYEFNWRRPINFEYFENGNEESKLNQLCETRIMGGATRSNPLKSLAIYANKRFGTKRLEYEFFPDQRPGITDFKSISLRNAGNDFDYLYMRDAIIQRNMAQHVDLDWQSWRPVIVYINGVYKGIENIRDRSNEDNIYTYYDGLEDLDMFENWDELKEGDRDNYNAFKAFYAEHGHTLAEYEQWMDCGEFANLMIMNLYYNNQDFPGNNIVMWRPKTEGGRWRWIAKDTDFGLGLYGSSASYKTINWLYNPNYDANRNWANQYEHTRLFRRLMEDQDFYNMFIDRCAVYMGDFLNEKGTRAVWDSMYELVKTELMKHKEMYKQWWVWDVTGTYNDELTTARNWISQRTNYFYQQLADYYHLGTPTPLTINKGMTDLGNIQISINDVELSEGIFDGKFFANRSITLEATPADGKQVTGWDITTTATNGTPTTSHVNGALYTFTMPTCKSLAIKAVIGTTAINTIKQGKVQDAQYYSIDGKSLSQPQHGINIVRKSDGTTQKVIK
ncbi:MAG: CotH kinase family protein [Prevotella sp.]|nr:CotH kinase family protein [Prevotella sp.]